MKKRVFVLATGLISTFVVSHAVLAQGILQPVRPQVQPIEVVGEVVDAWCYSSKTVGIGRGPAHKKCAETCIMGGVSAGIVDDKGTLYVATKTRAYQGANYTLLPFVAKRVWVKGYLAKLGGNNLIKISEVKEFKPGMKMGSNGPYTPKAATAGASSTQTAVEPKKK